MAIFPNGVRVDLPRPIPRRNSLLDVFNPANPGDEHWIVGGVNWEDDLCGAELETFIDNCPPTTGFTKTPQVGGINFCMSDPFNVKASIQCSVPGRRAGDWFEIARQRMLVFESKAVEEVFWTGLTANATVSPSLAFGNEDCDLPVTDLTSGTPVNPVDGISLLEGAIAETFPGEGYIHVPATVPSYLAALLQISPQNGGLYSPSGSRYVVGAGYPGSGPENDAAAAGTAWLFATGPVGIWQSDLYMVPDNISQAVDRQINNVTVQAERYFTIGYSCEVFAVNINLTCSCE